MTHPKLCITCTYKAARFCTHGNPPDLVDGGFEIGDPEKYCRQERKEGAACGPDAINYSPRQNKSSPTIQFLDCVDRIADSSSHHELAEKLGIELGKAIAKALIDLSNSQIKQSSRDRNPNPV